LRAGGSHADVVKFLKCNVNTSIAEAFDAFLKLGTNPDNYPIRARELIEANASDYKILKARVQGWLTTKNARGEECPNVPLLGATKFDINAFFADTQRRDSMKDNELDNLAGFLIQIGTTGFADMVDDIFHAIAQSPVAPKLLKRIRGTPLEDRMTTLFKNTANTGVRLSSSGKNK